eukprot:1158120-Pelagomonas_calceolata.AAC.12
MVGLHNHDSTAGAWVPSTSGIFEVQVHGAHMHICACANHKTITHAHMHTCQPQDHHTRTYAHVPTTRPSNTWHFAIYMSGTGIGTVCRQVLLRVQRSTGPNKLSRRCAKYPNDVILRSYERSIIKLG